MPKRVVNWFDNGQTDRFLQITVAKPAKNGRAQLACTSNHLIRTPGGWCEAGELKVGDRVLEALPHYLSDFQWEALRGTLMGDGALSQTRSGHGARFRYSHCEAQASSDWKASLFSNLGSSRHVRRRRGRDVRLPPLPELARCVRASTPAEEGLRRRLPEAPHPLSLALWYMDDAHLAIRSKGVQKRTAGLTGRAEIGVEAMEPRHP